MAYVYLFNLVLLLALIHRGSSLYVRTFSLDCLSLLLLKSYFNKIQFCGSALVSMRIWIQFFASMPVRIQGPNQCESGRPSDVAVSKFHVGNRSENIHVGPNYLEGRKLLSFVIVRQFPCSWIRIQEIQVNVDPIHNTEIIKVPVLRIRDPVPF